MITCDLKGGLGNQLFQIFATMAFGIQYNIKYIFPYSTVLTNGVPRNTYWETIFSRIKTEATTFQPSHGFTNEQLYNLPMINEQTYRHTPFPETADHCMFNGYFQTYKYFENTQDQIYSTLNLDEQLSASFNEHKPLFLNTNGDVMHTIAIHFRMGDYKEKQQYHPIMSYAYYERALEYIMDSREDIKSQFRVLYFCEEEDISEATHKINRLFHYFSGGKLDFVRVDHTIPDWKQMFIMAQCNDIIIPNSTFSWWGAYLNKRPDKIVCYPNVWFGPYLQNDVSDMCPESWKIIDAIS